MTNDDFIALRLPHEMAEAIEARANASGKTVSAWLRGVLQPILAALSKDASR
jgi:predicted DNA-binding protein